MYKTLCGQNNTVKINVEVGIETGLTERSFKWLK